MELVIDRSKWLRGTDNGKLLRESDGKMCCLGFFGLACGLSAERLAGHGLPEEEGVDDLAWPEWLLLHPDCGDEVMDPRDTLEASDLVEINDSGRIREAEREGRIAAIFAKHGVEVRFVDGLEQPRAAPSETP